MNWAETRRVRLRHLFARRDLTGRSDLQMLSVYRDYGVVPRAGRDDNYNKPGEDLSTYRVVRRGDLVLNKMKTWQGSLGISRYDGIVSPAYFVARPLTDDYPEFLHHLLRSSPLIAEYAARSKGIRPSQWDLPWEEFQSIFVELPPAATQRCIANYLDRETARIDALMAAKRRMVELLEERWRSAVKTTMAALMTERGSIQLRHLVSCLDGRRVPLSAVERAGRQGDYPYYGASGIVDRIDGWLFDEVLILLGEDGAQLGDPGYPVAQVVRGKIWVNNHAHVLRPRATDPDFLALHLNTFDRNAFLSGGTREKITQDDMNRIPVPHVTMQEQHRVGLQLSKVRAHSDDMAVVLCRQIELLQERHQALTSAAVTGQVDIPETT